MEKKCVLRAVLLEKDNDMQTILLPMHKEGQYIFYERNNGYEYPLITIEGIEEQWIVKGLNGCSFDSIDASAFVLSGTVVLLVRSRYREYFMYVEEIKETTQFVPYYFEPNNEMVIGRSRDCDIYYPNLMIGRKHAKLLWDGWKWLLTDLESQNGVYVNGRRKSGQEWLNVGDIVYILGLYIVIGVDFISMNNSDGRVIINNSKIHPIRNYSEISYAEALNQNRNTIFDRVTRSGNDLSVEDIELEMPPAPLSNGNMPMLLRMGSQALYGGRALVTGNLFAAFSSLFMPALTQGLTEKDRKEYEAKRKEIYTNYLKRKEEEIASERKREEKLLEYAYPQLSTTLEFAMDKKRLWERRTFDEDFLSIRVGHGNVPMMAKISYQKRKISLEEDELLEDMYEIAEKEYRLQDAPVMINLKQDYVMGIRGSRFQRLRLINHMIMQLILTHSYDEVKLVLLIEGRDEEELDYVRYLPHNWDNNKTIRFFCCNTCDTPQISKYLNKYIEKSDHDISGKKQKIPAYVIFATNKKLYESIECLKKIQEGESYSGISLVAAFEGMPKECKKIVEPYSESAYRLIDLYNVQMPDVHFELDAASYESKLQGMEELMHTKLNIEGMKYLLPDMLTFLELYKVGKVEHLNPLKRWKENNPVKSLAVPLGVGTDGKDFVLDLHEKYHGPHGLIAGGTGSGKSEFIITYILSMAVNYSPDEVAFLLIDYKGGGLADAFVNDKKGIHLPHVIGTITNLDGAAISRSLLSINSELKRRQRLFKEAKGSTEEGTMDIYDYQKMYRNGRVSEPLPHLFIIADEFAELKKQEPEFMDELISIARIGRSLGVHLILATQKPTGVVNDQIWSNTKFRICLRVATKSDSMEMLKRAEAAEIKNTGRFYLQVGYNELFAMGQSAWCGADYIPQDEVYTEVDNKVEFVDNTGQTIMEARPQRKIVETKGKQIVAIVNYLSELAKNEGILPKQLWCEPLPERMDWDELQAFVEKEEGMKALIGMADDPKHQRQFPYQLDMLSFRSMFICGNSGSGKSSYIKTLLYSLVTQYSPEWFCYYILDLSGGALRSYAKLPHCGVYLTEQDEADFLRLLTLLKQMVAKRKQLFMEHDVTTYEAYRKIGKLPLIAFIIDGYANILSFREGNTIHATLYETIRESGAYGIRILLSVNHLNELHSRTRQEVDYRVALQAKDRYEYTDILEIRTTYTIPNLSGRGMCRIEDTTYEYHVAQTDAKEEEQVQALRLKERIEMLCERYQDVGHARMLPRVDGKESYQEFFASFEKGRLPLGYHLKDMKKIALPFQQMSYLSVYFGNPLGRRAVFENIMYTARQNDMCTIIVKRLSDSIFQSFDVGGGEDDILLMEPTADTLMELKNRINKELADRNVYRDAFCEKNGLPRTDKKRILKAARYIRENTRPLLFIFESIADIARLDIPDEEVRLSFEQVYFSRLKGYNIYFVAGFYPEDRDVQGTVMVQNYLSSQMSFIFGGCFDKQYIITPTNSEISGSKKMNPEYDRFIMKYREGLYAMRMPCGELVSEEDEPDEAAII